MPHSSAPPDQNPSPTIQFFRSSVRYPVPLLLFSLPLWHQSHYSIESPPKTSLSIFSDQLFISDSNKSARMKEKAAEIFLLLNSSTGWSASANLIVNITCIKKQPLINLQPRIIAASDRFNRQRRHRETDSVTDNRVGIDLVSIHRQQISQQWRNESSFLLLLF